MKIREKAVKERQLLRMINYKELKHNDNGMPTWDAFLGLLLYVANTKNRWVGRYLINETLKEIKCPMSYYRWFILQNTMTRSPTITLTGP